MGSAAGTDRFKRSRKERFRKGAELRVRPAKRADLTFIGLISEKIFRPYGPYGDIISQWFTSGATMTLVADAGPDPVGFVMLRHGARTGPSTASEIMAIGVEPAWRQRGIGVMLLREVEREAKRADINILFLHTAEDNLPAHKLFIKMGFSPLRRKEHFYPEGQDALLMFKNI